MRVRDHIALSTATAAALRPWLGRRVAGLWAGAVLIDADHYVWFCASQRRLHPVAAVRFFNSARAPRHPQTRALHSPLVLLLALLVGIRHRPLLPVAVGMVTHTALDFHYESRMKEARLDALRRDNYTCQACGARRTDLDTHLARQPWLLPSYRPDNLISLCDRCHEAAHVGQLGAPSWN